MQVPFFSDDEEAPSTPKADALFIPRENPRTLIIHPIEQWPSRNRMDKQIIPKDKPIPTNENGNIWYCYDT